MADGVNTESHPYFPGSFENPNQFLGQKKQSKEKEYEVILDLQHCDSYKQCKAVMKTYIFLCSHTGIGTCRESM